MVRRGIGACILYLGWTLTACIPCATMAHAVEEAAPARPTLGAIRWDGWFQGNPWQRNLDPQPWHYRLPFYGKEISQDQVEVHGDTQEIMDQEIGYAKAAGLDYWAFLHYQSEFRGQGVDRYNYRQLLGTVRRKPQTLGSLQSDWQVHGAGTERRLGSPAA